jgi:hypothetical protein
MAHEHVHCPVCARLVKTESLERAGTHQLSIRTVLRGLGKGRGFEWSIESLRMDVLVALEQALQRALVQVQMLKVQVAAQPIYTTMPDSYCRKCGDRATWHVDAQRFSCGRCAKWL